MKKILLASVLLLYISNAFAQPIDTTNAKKRIRTASDLKTGNSQDVLISFFQLALNNLTGKEKTFKFESSLFALKAKTDSLLFVDTSFLKQTSARNFVFTIAPTLDSNFKFKSNTFGIKYALINNRDKAIFDFALPSETEWNQVQTGSLKEYAQTIPNGILNPKYQLASNFFLDVEEDEDGIKRTPLANLPKDFQIILQKKLNESRSFRLSSFENFRDTLAGEYAALARYVENRALLTIDANFLNNRNAIFSGLNFNSEYLKGILRKNERMNVELNLKASLNFDDDTLSKLSTDLQRQTLALSGGFNWIIVKNRKSQSIIECKAAVAYHNVLKGMYNNEERSKFTGEGTLRLRITKDLWIPVDIRYDPGNGNVFGFLSLRSNFDWLTSKK